MTLQLINMGASGSITGGDDLRIFATKVNANFIELYNHVVNYNNPHQTTAAQVGATNGSGGGNASLGPYFIASSYPAVNSSDLTTGYSYYGDNSGSAQITMYNGGNSGGNTGGFSVNCITQNGQSSGGSLALYPLIALKSGSLNSEYFEINFFNTNTETSNYLVLNPRGFSIFQNQSIYSSFPSNVLDIYQGDITLTDSLGNAYFNGNSSTLSITANNLNLTSTNGISISGFLITDDVRTTGGFTVVNPSNSNAPLLVTNTNSVETNGNFYFGAAASSNVYFGASTTTNVFFGQQSAISFETQNSIVITNPVNTVAGNTFSVGGPIDWVSSGSLPVSMGIGGYTVFNAGMTISSFAGLPVGSFGFASDCLNPGEVSGTGTGSMVFVNNNNIVCAVWSGIAATN